MVEVVAIVGAALLSGVAVFQVGLAFGAPWGDHAYGGRAPTQQGRLPTSYRAMSAAAVPILLLSGWILLSHADVVAGDAGWVDTAIWIVFGYLLVNTMANLTSTSRVERYVMGSVTALTAAAALIVAVGA